MPRTERRTSAPRRERRSRATEPSAPRLSPQRAFVVQLEIRRLADQTAGHNGLLAVLAPNVPAKPDTVMFNKVTIKGAGQAVQMFGPAQAAVAKAVVDSVADGTIPKASANDLCVIVGVFIHWQAKDNKKIYDYNYRATKESITRAMKGQPTVDSVVAQKDTAKHPFA